MNQLTEALAKQAAESAIEFAVKDQELYIPKLMEKFAELIVRECANQLIKWNSEPFPLDPNHAAKIIQEHFGVSE